MTREELEEKEKEQRELYGRELERLADEKLLEQLDEALERSKMRVNEKELDEKLNRELAQFELEKKEEVPDDFLRGSVATAKLFACIDRLAEKEGWPVSELKAAKKYLQNIIFSAGE